MLNGLLALGESKMRFNRAKASQFFIIVGFAAMCVWCVTVAAKHEFVDVKFLVQTRNDKPVVGASVVIQRSSGDKESKTDDKGWAEFSHVEFEVTKPYTVKITATDYKPQDFVIAPSDFAESVKSHKPVEHFIILVSTEPSQPGDTSKNNNSSSPAVNQNVTDNHVDHWYDPIVDVVSFLRTYWWLLLSVLIIATVVVLLLMGYRIKVYRYGQSFTRVKEKIHWIHEDTRNIKVDLKEVKLRLDLLVGPQSPLTSRLTSIEHRLKELPISPVPPPGQDDVSSSGSTNDRDYLSQRSSLPPDYYRTTPSAEETARTAYRSLTKSEAPLVEPIYLKTDVKSSPLASLENDEVYLQAVANTQGAFVLFPDPDGRWGRVFPNPGVDFRPETLKRLFPRLAEMGETQFQTIKAQIDPVRVRQIEPGRWVVE
jgi:hypothetical protein